MTLLALLTGANSLKLRMDRKKACVNEERAQTQGFLERQKKHPDFKEVEGKST